MMSRMERDSDSPAARAAGQHASAGCSPDVTATAAADFERAIGAAERNGSSPNVNPRVHEAMIQAMRSELAKLRKRPGAR